MIGERHVNPQGVTAASLILPFQPVRLSPSANNSVIPVATWNLETDGLNGAATAAAGEEITIYGPESVVQAKAAASVGPGALVGAAADGEVTPVAAASGVLRHAVGKTLQAAADGDVFALHIRPERLADNS